LASPEDDFGDELDLPDDCDLGVVADVAAPPYDASLAAIEAELGHAPSAPGLRLAQTARRAARRELRWFYTRMHGRVPAVGDASPREVAAAARIGRWLSEVAPGHRGAFVLRYDGRRWPARVLREFGHLTTIIVRFSALQRPRGPNETLAEAEEATVTQLLADIVASRCPVDLSGAEAHRRTIRLRRLRLAAHRYVQRAEHAYFDVRGGAPCAVPADVREGT
jgi:hypothetical protein